MTEQYRKLLIDIIIDGEYQEGRNGGQFIIPHAAFTVDFRTESQILKLRKMHTKGILGEFKTLIDPTPLTNVTQFEANGCRYWSQWGSPGGGSLRLDYHSQMHPQLQDVINNIKTDPNSRRHVISLWNHDNVQNGVLSLPCCWYSMIFTVIGKTLHMNWVQRSVDTMLGLPSDVYLAHLFMQHVAEQTGLEVGSCQFSLSNVHIYEEMMPAAKELVLRTEADHGKPLDGLVLKA